jgi:hypothetical protein
MPKKGAVSVKRRRGRAPNAKLKMTTTMNTRKKIKIK